MLASRRLEVIVAVSVVILDQITKAMIRHGIGAAREPRGDSRLSDLTRVHNTGAAFGMLNSVDFRSRRWCCHCGRDRVGRRRVVRCDGCR